tara:strand:- start:686 stop:1294 length:609 start_codon:yes stop_codon:yes gene_type:complete
MTLFICTSTILIIFSSVGSTQEVGKSAYFAEIKQFRAQKDSVFKFGPDSPIKKEHRPSFDGLNYFPVNKKYRVIGKLHRYARLTRIKIPSTDGGVIMMERWGRIYFQWKEKTFWLEAYRSPETAQIEVFFTDRTNGEETYEMGRYVQLIQETNGLYLIDFNNTYNPYCVYNNFYVCPLPPPNNHLSFEVKAGEVNFGTILAH